MKIQSVIPKGVALELDSDGLEYCNAVYMCIKEAGETHYAIPDNLSSIVYKVLDGVYQLDHNIDDWKKYCYLTIKKMYVQPNTSGNRDGWHIDGFLSDQDNFIWSDCDATPTQVSVGGFNLTPNHEDSLEEMLVQASQGGHFTHNLESGILYQMGQNIVHRPSRNNTHKAVLRTFIKLTFSSELFNCVGNAWNYKLPHIKPTAKRAETRNHTVL